MTVTVEICDGYCPPPPPPCDDCWPPPIPVDNTFLPDQPEVPGYPGPHGEPGHPGQPGPSPSSSGLPGAPGLPGGPGASWLEPSWTSFGSTSPKFSQQKSIIVYKRDLRQSATDDADGWIVIESLSIFKRDCLPLEHEFKDYFRLSGKGEMLMRRDTQPGLIPFSFYDESVKFFNVEVQVKQMSEEAVRRSTSLRLSY